jgi:hypothetical protein
MSDLNTLMSQIPVGDIAKQLGVDDDTAEAAIKQVLPGLVGGLQANAEAGGGASLEKALSAHKNTKIRSLADVDTNDGKKIVKNVFGENEDKVAAKLADGEPKPNVTMDIIKQVLPIVAPIVLSFIASQFLNKSSDAGSKSSDAKAAPASSGSDIGSMLGGLLADPNTQNMVGGLLGGLLGGGKK